MFKSLSAITFAAPAAASVSFFDTLEDLTLLDGLSYEASTDPTPVVGSNCDLAADSPVNKDWSLLDLQEGTSWKDNNDYDCYCAEVPYQASGIGISEVYAAWTASFGDEYNVAEVKVLSDADTDNSLENTKVEAYSSEEDLTSDCEGGGADAATWYTYDCAADYPIGAPASEIKLLKENTEDLVLCGVKIMAYQSYTAWQADLSQELADLEEDCDDVEVLVGTVTQALTSLDTDWAELYEDYGTLYDNYVQAQYDLDAAQDAFNDATGTFNALDADFVAAQSDYTELVDEYTAAAVLSGEKEATLVSYEDRAVAPKCLFGVLGWYMYCREFDEIDGEAAEDDAEEEEE